MEKTEILEKEIEQTIYTILDWRLFEITDTTEKKALLNEDNYKIEDDKIIIIDLDRETIKPYVKYLIKGMEWSRELVSILINRYIQIFIVVISLLIMYLVSQRPNLEEIKSILNTWKSENVMTNFMEATKPEIKLNENINPIIQK